MPVQVSIYMGYTFENPALVVLIVNVQTVESTRWYIQTRRLTCAYGERRVKSLFYSRLLTSEDEMVSYF